MPGATTEPKRPVCIAGCLSSFTDRTLALTRMAVDPDVDAVVGGWLADMTMVMHGTGRAKKLNGESNSGFNLEERKKITLRHLCNALRAMYQ
jgi:hypothetical protein